LNVIESFICHTIYNKALLLSVEISKIKSKIQIKKNKKQNESDVFKREGLKRE